MTSFAAPVLNLKKQKNKMGKGFTFLRYEFSLIGLFSSRVSISLCRDFYMGAVTAATTKGFLVAVDSAAATSIIHGSFLFIVFLLAAAIRDGMGTSSTPSSSTTESFPAG